MGKKKNNKKKRTQLTVDQTEEGKEISVIDYGSDLRKHVCRAVRLPVPDL